MSCLAVAVLAATAALATGFCPIDIADAVPATAGAATAVYADGDDVHVGTDAGEVFRVGATDALVDGLGAIAGMGGDGAGGLYVAAGGSVVYVDATAESPAAVEVPLDRLSNGTVAAVAVSQLAGMAAVVFSEADRTVYFFQVSVADAAPSFAFVDGSESTYAADVAALSMVDHADGSVYLFAALDDRNNTLEVSDMSGDTAVGEFENAVADMSATESRMYAVGADGVLTEYPFSVSDPLVPYLECAGTNASTVVTFGVSDASTAAASGWARDLEVALTQLIEEDTIVVVTAIDDTSVSVQLSVVSNSNADLDTVLSQLRSSVALGDAVLETLGIASFDDGETGEVTFGELIANQNPVDETEGGSAPDDELDSTIVIVSSVAAAVVLLAFGAYFYYVRVLIKIPDGHKDRPKGNPNQVIEIAEAKRPGSLASFNVVAGDKPSDSGDSKPSSSSAVDIKSLPPPPPMPAEETAGSASKVEDDLEELELD